MTGPTHWYLQLSVWALKEVCRTKWGVDSKIHYNLQTYVTEISYFIEWYYTKALTPQRGILCEKLLVTELLKIREGFITVFTRAWQLLPPTARLIFMSCPIFKMHFNILFSYMCTFSYGNRFFRNALSNLFMIFFPFPPVLKSYYKKLITFV
jgi:hypothetical protein